MGAKTFKSSKPPSRQVTEQAARVPHRSCVAATARAGAGDERLIVASAQRAQRALGASRAGRKAGTGKTSRQNLKNVKFNIDQKVVYLVSDPISAVGGAVGRQGWLAPEGAIAKVAEMTELPFPEPGWALAGGKDLQAVAKRRGGELFINIGIAFQRQKSGRLKGGQGKASVAGRGGLARGLEGAGRSPSKRRAEDLCGSSRTRPQGRGFPCGWEGESCL
jgi:hypothetical protein